MSRWGAPITASARFSVNKTQRDVLRWERWRRDFEAAAAAEPELASSNWWKLVSFPDAAQAEGWIGRRSRLRQRGYVDPFLSERYELRREGRVIWIRMRDPKADPHLGENLLPEATQRFLSADRARRLGRGPK